MTESEPAHELVLADPRPVTAGFAFTFAGALLVLGIISIAWVGFLIVAAALLVVEGTGFPAIMVGATGVLLYRAWRAMAESMRRRLHPMEIEDYDALPPHFGMLSASLQRVVFVTRTTRAAIAEPDLSQPEVSRALFEWLMILEALEGDDVRDLRDRGFSVDGLRDELEVIGQSPRPGIAADALLSRFEASLLHRGVDPFR